MRSDKTSLSRWVDGDELPSQAQANPISSKNVVFLSIEGKHGWAILEHKKDYEYRRTPPSLEPPYKVILYATGDIGAIIGEFVCDNVITTDIDSLIKNTVASTPHTESELRSYFDGKETGSAMEISSREQYDEPLPLSTLDGITTKFVPQNFRYLRPDEHEEILQQLP